MGKKLLALVLTLTMALALALPASALSESEQTAVDRWTANGVLDGVGGGNFDPEATITRGDAAMIFANLLKLEDSASLAGFTDLDPADANYDAFAKCVAAGIFKGNGDGTMGADTPLSREMFFTVFCRALGIKEADTADNAFADASSTEDWYAGAINALANKGYVKGTGDNMLSPKADMSGANLLSLLNQTISVYANEDGATVEGTGEGVVLVVAKNVTVTGEVADLIVGEGASDGEVTLKDATVTGDAIVNTDAKVELTGETKVESLAVNESAEGASVVVGKDAAVAALVVEADSTALENNGTIAALEVAATGVAVTDNGTIEETTVADNASDVIVNGEDVTKTEDTNAGSDTNTNTPTNTTDTSTYVPIYVPTGADTLQSALTDSIASVNNNNTNYQLTQNGETITVTITNSKTTISEIKTGVADAVVGGLNNGGVKTVQVGDNSAMTAGNDGFSSDEVVELAKQAVVTMKSNSTIDGTSAISTLAGNSATITATDADGVTHTYTVEFKNGTSN